MAKGKFNGGKSPKGGMGGGMGNMQAMIKQAQKMQADMLKAQEELEEMETEVTVGGGAVRVVLKGSKTFQAIEIKPEVVDADDVEMLQDLVLSAVNEAMKIAHDRSEDSMKDATGGMGMPGISGLF